MSVVVIGKNNNLVRETSCRNCASRLEFVRNDVQNRTQRDYTGFADTFYFIRCPVCHSEVHVNP